MPEVYAEITFGKQRYASIAFHCPQRTIVTTGLSKGFSAGGHRVGLMMLPAGMEPIMTHLAALASETFSAVATPVQHAAAVALSQDKAVRKHVEDSVAIHSMATEYLWRGITKLGLRCPKPGAAFYLFPDFSPFADRFQPPGVSSDVELCADLLDREGVAMPPGSAFSMHEDQLSVRIASADYDGESALKAFQKKEPTKAMDKRKFIEKRCPNLGLGLERLGEYIEGR